EACFCPAKTVPTHVAEHLLRGTAADCKGADRLRSRICRDACLHTRPRWRDRPGIDSVIDVRAVFQQAHRELAIEAMPALLLPKKGRYGLRDYEKMFCPDIKSGQDIFAMRGIDRQAGCLVVVRPDQYVAQVLPIDAYEELASYFNRFMLPPRGGVICV